MAVIVHVTLQGVTSEQYDQVRATVGWLETHPVGGLGHLTWWEGEDCHNTDVWESESAFGAFVAERLGPALAEVGVAVEPQVAFHPAHEVFLPQALTITT